MDRLKRFLIILIGGLLATAVTDFCFLTAIAQPPGAAEAAADNEHLRRGFSYFHTNAELAAAEFDKCRDFSKLADPNLVRVAQVYVAASQHAKALKIVNQALDHARASGKPLSKDCMNAAYEVLSESNYATGHLDQAVADYEKCASLRKEGDPEALKKAADIRARQGRNEDALRLYSKAIATQKEGDPSPYLYRGICLQKIGRINEAVTDFSQAIKLCKEAARKVPGACSVSLSNSYVHRAQCYEKLGKAELAKSDHAAHEMLSRSYENDFFGKH
ncbi:MAG: hypothetical protein JSS83_01945 [Cyanobacteria bacterium SZAS LIN-3]|nr:hypothetical protein [Cyanobacteria bacterium SZAS LIN-3]